MYDDGVEVDAWMNLTGPIEVQHMLSSRDVEIDLVEITVGGVSMLFDEESLDSCATGFAAALAALRVRIAADMRAAGVPAAEVRATEVPATEVPATEVPATEVPATEVPAAEATART